MVAAEELASLGSVPRTLTFDVDDQSEEPPASIPSDFRGNVEMSAPQLVVEVSVKKVKQSSLSDDDDDDDDDSGCNVSNEQDGTIEKFLLNFITACHNARIASGNGLSK